MSPSPCPTVQTCVFKSVPMGMENAMNDVVDNTNNMVDVMDAPSRRKTLASAT